jgi:hypothetical protein
MDGDVENLKGFSWRGDMERDTVGILVWSQPFLINEVIPDANIS